MLITKKSTIRMFSSFIICFFLASCASQNKRRNIPNKQHDGLRFESLNRYDSNRLSSVNKYVSDIAKCHQNQYTDAYKSLKQKLEKEKSNPLYWNQIGTCYLLNQKYTQAKFYFTLALGAIDTSIKKNKRSKYKAIIMNNLGLNYLRLKKYNLAQDHFQRATELNPRFLTPKYNKTQIYLKFGLFGKAETLLSFLYKRNKNDVDFTYSLGHLYLMKNQYSKAKHYFALLPKMYLTRDDIATNYAMTLFMLGDYKGSQSILANAEMKSSQLKKAQLNLIDRIKLATNN